MHGLVQFSSIRELLIQLLVEKMGDHVHAKRDNCCLYFIYSTYRYKIRVTKTCFQIER